MDERYTSWAVYAPGKMNTALNRRIYEEFATAVKAPAVTEKVAAQGIDVAGARPADLDAFGRKEIPRWVKVISDNAISSATDERRAKRAAAGIH